jgi:hypothetical protein
MDVSDASLRIWMPALHTGMTKIGFFMFSRRAQAHESLRGKNSFYLRLGVLGRSIAGNFYE